MPMVEVFTREGLSEDKRAVLAEGLTTTMIRLEVEDITDAARAMSLVLFHTLGASGLVVGGALDARYEAGRTFAIARVVAPEAFLNSELKARAIQEITSLMMTTLDADQKDDGSGVFVSIEEVPANSWGSRGRVSRLPSIIERTGGHVSEERLEEQRRHFQGYDQMKEQFGIPS